MSSAAGVPPPPQARGRARYEALLAAAAGLVAQHGVDGVAFSQIARAAGTAQGSLYQFFPSKEALVATLHARLADRLVAVVEGCESAFRDAAGPHTAAALVALLVGRLAPFYAANPAYREIRHALPRDPAILAAEGQADDRVARTLARMLNAANLTIAGGRLPLVVSALIEAGDALLPWAGEDAARLAEVEALLLAYLTAPGPSRQG